MTWAITRLKRRNFIRKSLINYPPYLPPHVGKKLYSSRTFADENFEFFLRNRYIRIQNLSDYFKGLEYHAESYADYVAVIDEWLYKFGGYLIPKSVNFNSSISYYDPPWDSELKGLSLINDISILCGEYIISHNSNFYWGVYYDSACDIEDHDVGHAQPCLFGLQAYRYTNPHSMLWDIYDVCRSSFRRIYQKGPSIYKWDSRGELIYHLKKLSKSQKDD